MVNQSFTFISWSGCEFLNDSWQSRGHQKAVSACSSSQNFHSSQSFICQNGFGTTCDCMSFIKPVKNAFVLCVIEHFQSSLRDFLSPKKVSKSLRNSWNDFFLLNLVIEDGNFFTIRVFELRSDKRVAGNDGASFRKSEKECSWDERSCNEHGCI